MISHRFVITAAVEPPAGLSEVTPLDSVAVLSGSQGVACFVTDPSASWGVGTEAAKLTVDRVRAYSGTNVTETHALAQFAEDAAFQAEAALARQNPEADALFSGALVTLGGQGLSWAWAGDIIVALCSQQSVVCLNTESPSADVSRSTWTIRRAPWYPGLLGCSRAQRRGQLFAFGGPVTVAPEQAVLALSQAVWSKLDEQTIVDEIRRAATQGRAWQSQVVENLLRIAKSRGAAGHRAVVGIYPALDASAAESEPLARFRGYQALSIADNATRLVVEERQSDREVLVVEVLGLSGEVLTVTFKNPTRDLNRATARRLVYELVLEGYWEGRFRANTKIVHYVDLDSNVTTKTAYGWPA